jgi:three-Cys-motif partner protein
MASETFFNEPFDEGTNCKLEVYRLYLREWLPVFLSSPFPKWKNVNIFDFFSGQGKDANGVLGSPLITLEELSKSTDYIVNHKLNVRLFFNEWDNKLFNQLTQNVSLFLKPKIYSMELSNKDFRVCFEEQLPFMQNAANLIFLDQKGVKFITNEVFQKLISLRQTDFLFFISSSFIKRFGESEEFKKYLKIRSEDIEKKDYFHIHRLVLEYYRSLIPNNKQYFLAPFSIRKTPNIYGLIFGSNHTYGIEKFLKICWRMDKQRGEANFDIDREKIDPTTPSLFPDFNKPTKRKVFEDELEKKVLDKKLTTNQEVYLFTLDNGFLPKDANEVLRKLEKEGKIVLDCKLVSVKIHQIPVGSIKVK